MSAKFALAGGGPGVGGSPSPAAETPEKANAFFRRRTVAVVAAGLVFIAVNALSGVYVGFDFLGALMDIPSGFAWMAVEFVPTVESFEKLDAILPALGSTILVSVAASCLAAVIAYVFAVLGSRSVGLGGPIPLIVRGIASLFRNIPTVAWAFILLFSFKQSDFTGFWRCSLPASAIWCAAFWRTSTSLPPALLRRCVRRARATAPSSPRP